MITESISLPVGLDGRDVGSFLMLMVLTDGGLSGTDDDDDDDELVASMRAFRHTRTESGATLATHYSAVRQCSSGGQQ